MVSAALWVVLATGGLALSVAILSWRRQPQTGARSFAIAMGGIAWWLVFMFINHSIADVAPRLGAICSRLEALGAAILAIYWFRFALEYTGRGEYVTRRVMLLLWSFPLVGLPIALGSTQFLELYASWLGVAVSLPPWDIWRAYKGIGFGYLYVLFIAGFVLILGLVLSQRLPRPELASLWLIGSLVPMVVGGLFIAGVFPSFAGLDPTPLAFVVTGLVGLTAISRYDVFQSAPIARNYVVDRLEAGMVVFDESCRIIDSNEWAQSVLGIDADGQGRDVHEVLTRVIEGSLPADADAATFAAALDNRKVTTTDETGKRHLSIDVSPLQRPDGQRQGYTVLLYDVTVQRRYQERLERQNERLERLADVVSHDIRNPLDVGMSQARRLERDVEGNPDADERLQRRTADIHEALDRATVIVEDMLAMTRGGQPVTDPDEEELAHIAELGWNYVEMGDLELALCVDESATVEADRSRLVQVFENCYRNVVEHAAEATRVEVGTTDDGFYVADDGPGIPAEERDSVFDPGHTSAADGTGLGLSIVEEIANAHDWEVAVASSDDGGTRLEFTTEFRVDRSDTGSGDPGSVSTPEAPDA